MTSLDRKIQGEFKLCNPCLITIDEKLGQRYSLISFAHRQFSCDIFSLYQPFTPILYTDVILPLCIPFGPCISRFGRFANIYVYIVYIGPRYMNHQLVRFIANVFL